MRTAPIFKGTQGRSVAACGETHDVLRSALQKYIRRGMAEKAIRCAIELDRFSEVGSQGEPIRTNMINRLAIIAMEDIGLANPFLLPWVEKQREAWKSARKSVESREILIGIVAALAASPKSRLVSHARSAYTCWPLAAAHELAPWGRCLPPAEEIAGVADDVKALAFLRALLRARDLRAVSWADTLSRMTLSTIFSERRKSPIARSRRGIEAVWLAIREVSTDEKSEIAPVVESLYAWHRQLPDARENLCFAICAILLICNFREGFLSCDGVEFAGLKTLESIAAPPDKQKRPTESKFTVDAFCRDKHTAAGRARGASTREFVEVGAKIENAAAYAANAVYEEIYRRVRIGVGESELFSDPLRIQLVTSEAKTCTYFATANNFDVPLCGKKVAPGAPLFVKGPVNEERAEVQLFVDNLKRLFSGMRPVGYGLVRAIPEFFPDTPLGLRKSAARGEQAPFLVAPNHKPRAEPPSKFHESKMWPKTKIYDGGSDPSVDLADPSPAALLALAFRFVLGVGDTCARNLLAVGDEVYSVDEESCFGVFPPVRTKLKKPLNARSPRWLKVADHVARWAGSVAAIGGELEAFAAPRIERLLADGPAQMWK